MNPEQKIVQYLNEAHATELALTRVLQSQIAMTPRGSYRSALETHLAETHDHTRRVQRRLSELGEGTSTLQSVVGFAETVVGPGRSRSARRRWTSCAATAAQEKVLKNAKDAAATEALEIATYTSIERLAKAAGDDKTAQLAASILADEEKMLARVLREIPKLTEAVRRRRVRSTSPPRAPARPSSARPNGDQARRPPDPQGAGRRPGRGPGQGRRRVRERPRDRALRHADRRRDPRPAAAALAGRPGQGRFLRAPAREPHDGAGARLHPARQRAVAGLRRAQRLRGPRGAGRGRRRPRLQGRAHLRARAQGPARACSTPPSANSRLPEPPPARGA